MHWALSPLSAPAARGTYALPRTCLGCTLGVPPGQGRAMQRARPAAARPLLGLEGLRLTVRRAARSARRAGTRTRGGFLPAWACAHAPHWASTLVHQRCVRCARWARPRACGRLVQEEDAGLGYQGAGQGQPPLLPPGEAPHADAPRQQASNLHAQTACAALEAAGCADPAACPLHLWQRLCAACPG